MGKYIGMSVGLFILFSVGIFAVLFYLIPPPKPVQKLTLDGVADSLLQVKTINRDKFEDIVTDFKSYTDSLENLIVELRTESAGKDVVTDSLQKLLAEKISAITSKEGEIKQLADVIQDDNTRAEKAKDIAKTLGSMDAKQISPIVTQLDNETVITIYEQMNSRSKKNLLLGLPRDRAAMITKKMLE